MEIKDKIECRYIQIQNLIINNIKTGKWPVYSKIKDEISLSEELGISRGTLRKAIKGLIDKGVLMQIKGKGTFVVSDIIQQPLASRLVSFSEAMKERNLSYDTVVLKKEIIKSDYKTSALLEIEPEETVIFIERLRIVDNLPIIYFKNYIPDLYTKTHRARALHSCKRLSLTQPCYWKSRQIFANCR